jgi:ANTAR domain
MPIDDELSAQVSQAVGMVSVQAECTVDEALLLMKERAQVSGIPLLDVAEATIEHRIRFGPTT